MSEGNILVVDEDLNSLRYLVNNLEKNHFQVYGINEIDKAIKLYKTGDIDIVLVSLQRNDSSGFNILDALKSYDPEAKVILYTDVGTKGNVMRALRMGASEFMEKPLEIEKLITTLRQLLAKESAPKAFQGDLRTMSLASIIQMNCEERIVGLLHLQRPGQEGRIYFDQGRIVHAETQGLKGEEAVYQMLRWDRGAFTLKMEVTPPLETIHSDWSGLILEGMRRIDEGQSGPELEWKEAGLAVEAEGDIEEDNSERLLRALSRIKGVNDVLIYSQNGEVTAEEPTRDGKKMDKAASYLIGQSKMLAEKLSADQIQRVLLRDQAGKEMLLWCEEVVIYFRFSKRTQADTLSREALARFQRYRS
ncbi:MAG: DUF4388 domain-containing protein [Anaerolineales bacterium]